MRTGRYLVLAVAALLTWHAKPVSARAGDGPVVEVGDLKPSAAQLTAEFAYLPPPVLQRLKSDDNSARIFAVEWYARALFTKAAQEDGFLKKHPGLESAAASRERDLIAGQFMRETAGDFRASDEEVAQYRKMDPEICRAPGRLRLARVGVITGKNALPAEAELAHKRFAEIEKSLGAGEDFGKVADEKSDYTAKAGGGDMGYVEIDKVRESPQGDALLKLTVGQISPALDTGQGKVIYKLIEREDSRELPAEECREKVDQVLSGKFRNDLFLRRVDELAARFKAKMDLDAFIAAVRAVPLKEGWERTWRAEDDL
jgi:hypothetical protein